MAGFPFPYPQQLQTALAVLGLSREAFAAICDLNPKTITKALDGKTVSPEVTRRILDELEKRREELEAAVRTVSAVA